MAKMIQLGQANLHMRNFWLATIAGSFLTSCVSHADDAKPLQVVTSSTSSSLPEEVELYAFLPAAAIIRLSARGDIDADGDDDALVVYAAATSADETPRTLMLLLRDADGVLRESVASPNAILCHNCGGMMGDPLQQIRVGRGEFTLRFEGGSRELWSSEFRFKYARDRSIWKLDEVVFGGFDRANGKTVERRQGLADFGNVPLDTFDAASFPADALP